MGFKQPLRSLRTSLASILIAACTVGTPTTSPPSSTGCQYDSQCKGDRVCLKQPGQDYGECTLVERITDGGKLDAYVPNNIFDAAVSCISHSSQVCSQGNPYWANSCGELEEMIQDCGQNQYCNNGSCTTEQPTCTSHATKACHAGDVYWKDSCGNIEDLFADCTSSQYCENAQCVNQCTSHASRVCNNGDVYWKDSCGNLQERAEDCSSSQNCSNGQCVTQQPQCTPHASRTCYNNGLYWQDSCGAREELIEQCLDIDICRDGDCYCTPQYSRVCYEHETYYADSCGNRENNRLETCDYDNEKCENGECMQRYQTRSDRTILDTVTNKVWQRDASASDLIFEDAQQYCNDLALAQGSWRLPMLSEYEELVNRHYESFSYVTSNLPDAFQGPRGRYWTSSSCDGDYRKFVDWGSNFWASCNSSPIYVRCIKN